MRLPFRVISSVPEPLPLRVTFHHALQSREGRETDRDPRPPRRSHSAPRKLYRGSREQRLGSIRSAYPLKTELEEKRRLPDDWRREDCYCCRNRCSSFPPLNITDGG